MIAPERGHCRRFKFHAAEDDSLRALVGRLGTDAWPSIASQMPGRNARQCRDRWNHYLKNRAGHPWTPRQEALLVGAGSVIGEDWKQMSPLETPQATLDVKSHWHKLTIPQSPPEGRPDVPSRIRFPSIPLDPTCSLELFLNGPDNVRESERPTEASNCLKGCPLMRFGDRELLSQNNGQ
jgi:hypothetical protein